MNMEKVTEKTHLAIEYGMQQMTLTELKPKQVEAIDCSVFGGAGCLREFTDGVWEVHHLSDCTVLS